MARTHYIDRRQQEVDGYERNCYVRHPEYPETLPEGECPRISNAPAGVWGQVAQYRLVAVKGRRRQIAFSCLAAKSMIIQEVIFKNICG